MSKCRYAFLGFVWAVRAKEELRQSEFEGGFEGKEVAQYVAGKKFPHILFLGLCILALSRNAPFNFIFKWKNLVWKEKKIL